MLHVWYTYLNMGWTNKTSDATIYHTYLPWKKLQNTYLNVGKYSIALEHFSIDESTDGPDCPDRKETILRAEIGWLIFHSTGDWYSIYSIWLWTRTNQSS